MMINLDQDVRFRDAVAERDRRADVASLAHLLKPASVAVIGAGRRPGSIGYAILANLRTSGYTGPVYAVNPHAAGTTLLGVECAATVLDLPEPPDLAVLTVPAAQVATAARDCGERGVQALVVVT